MTKNSEDQFLLQRFNARLRAIYDGALAGESVNDTPTKRGFTKSPFNRKYREHRKMRVKMAKRSRRINRR